MARNDKPRKVVNDVEFRYILQPYSGPSSRITCPNCGAKHSFARYVDVTTGKVLDDKYGKCERIERCGYFETPYGKDIEDKSLMVSSKKVLNEFKEAQNADISLISPAEVLGSLTLNDNFSQFLFSVFNPLYVAETLMKYKVGEDYKWAGATVFWQIDQDFDVRTGKIILYGEDGKRVKKPFPHITWAHTPDRNLEVVPDYNLKQCLFGEHLVSDEVETYYIVESEKTAIIGDICSTDRNGAWIAVGGLEMISKERLKPLSGKKLVFYPDKGDTAYDKWSTKLKPLMEYEDIQVSRFLEKTDLEEGADIGDYLINKYKNEQSI